MRGWGESSPSRRFLGDPQRRETSSRGLIENRAPEDLLSCDVDRVKGLALKRYEDTLDALFCAYLAWHCWRWGKARNECFGDLAHGYIVVPKAAT
jgi:hypothetical protein